MDSLRVIQSSYSASSQIPLRKQFRFLHHHPIHSRDGRLPLLHFSTNSRISLPLHHHSRSIRCVSSTETIEEEKMKSKSKPGKVRLNVRLDHQVKFGEHVAVLGSAKELGSWKKKVKLDWSESGWVGNLELKGGESIEFKFVIVGKDKSMLWENGENRVVKLPKQGSFGLVCHWNITGEAVDLLGSAEEDYIGENGSTTADAAASHLEVESSPFVGEWQGKDISFMRSNEHRNREAEGKWDTSGLEGLALKLVEGDRNARNWWRKVTTVD